MKRYILTGFFILVLGLLPFWSKAQFSDTRELVKEFAVSPETQIEIANKYGKIDINTWDKDSAVFEISIRVEEKKLSKLEESMRNIEFDVTSSGHYLIIKTEVEKNKGGLSKEFQKFKETLLSSDGNIQVDYTVWVPKTNRLKVENKFGDIFIGDYMGEVWINLSNGNLKANDFTENLDLTLNFADATINSVKKGRLDCNFSELYLKKAESVRIISKSTEFDLQEIGELNADSRRDKFRIQQVDLIDAQGSFSNFRINELTDRINLKSEYGDVEIDNIAADFGGVILQSKSTDISLYFNRESLFNFEINHSKTQLSLDDYLKVADEKVSDDEKTVTLKGSFGKSSEATPKLNITAESGSLSIRSK
ncbi:hypothetical protein [Maribellus sediminis]|uniref:hypothetical protein n=1 Tax=Maribellus sediminis TaxID=2696285 RepID=UPI001431D16E|nr:hypothetical protein [Maribellus sediminis]